jgi:2'-5' RNA ligase
MMKNVQSLRLFYALWPNDRVRAQLLEIQAPMRGKKIPYQNLHLTLAFLGEQPVDMVPKLSQILQRLPSSAFSMTLDRAGYFHRIRIAWAGMHEIPTTLLHLHHQLQEALMQHGIAFDNRNRFRPHVTLTRNALAPEDLPFQPVKWEADRIALVQSDTQPDGAIYRVIASRSLGDNKPISEW